MGTSKVPDVTSSWGTEEKRERWRRVEKYLFTE
jgi:hypothetical protein